MDYLDRIIEAMRDKQIEFKPSDFEKLTETDLVTLEDTMNELEDKDIAAALEQYRKGEL